MHCSGDETEVKLCKALFKRHAVARELFQTRRAMAKSLGLKWGAYHLGRPGNPIDQANNFIDFAEPAARRAGGDRHRGERPNKWMSLTDAEEFARHIQRRLGRFPVLYTNGATARYIAANRDKYPLLSRLPLWYARYKPEIGMHFPKGNWESFALWQFSSQANCNDRRCPIRIAGTPTDIDVNVAALTPAELAQAWPFGGLIDVPLESIATVPVPIARADGLAGPVALAYAPVAEAPAVLALAAAFYAGGERYPGRAAAARAGEALETGRDATLLERVSAYVAALPARFATLASLAGDAPGLDQTVTSTVTTTKSAD